MRHAIHIALLITALLLGIVTTFAVAWGMAASQVRLGQAFDSPRKVVEVNAADFAGPKPPHDRTAVAITLDRFPGTELWAISLHDADTLPAHFASRGELDVPAWVRAIATPWADNLAWAGEYRSSATLLARGWPWVTLWSSVRAASGSAVLDGGALYLEGWGRRIGAPRQMTLLPSAAAFDVPFPLRPIWRPFLASSAMWAAAWALILFALRPLPALLRRAIRSRRGLCVRCAYSRAGLSPAAPCPECGFGGAPHPPAARAATRATNTANQRTPGVG